MRRVANWDLVGVFCMIAGIVTIGLSVWQAAWSEGFQAGLHHGRIVNSVEQVE